VPTNNFAFTNFAYKWWGHKPTMSGYWEEREHARQWDTNAYYSAGDQQRTDATNPGEIYNEYSFSDITNRVQELLNLYYPNGRPLIVNPPVIVGFSPADNSTNVALEANFVLTFNKAIVRGTGNITLKNLTDGTQTTIAITDTTQVSVVGEVLTINPTANLLVGKGYAIQIPATAIGGLATNAFAGITNDTTWNFTTIPDYLVWAAHWPGANLSDPNADFDGDGQPNDHERIWGLNPTNAASRNPFTSTSNLAAGNFSYIRRSRSLTGLSYTVWTSTNLTTWAQDTGAVQTPGAAVAEVETVAVSLSPEQLTGPQLFVRVRAAR
jgi:hypothetical protein